jgi:hypothetical protein
MFLLDASWVNSFNGDTMEGKEVYFSKFLGNKV